MARRRKSQNKGRGSIVRPGPERVAQGEFFPQAVSYSKSTYFSGPLPDPETLSQYEQIQIGATDRIFGLAEREAAHRHEIERELVKIHGRNSTLGIISGALIGLASIAGGAYAIGQGAQLAGWAVVVTAVSALAGVFITQNRGENSQGASSSMAPSTRP